MRIFLCLLIFTSNYCIAQINLNAGLKAYYPFSGNANDVSGNNLNGTTQGDPQLTTDRFGNTNSAYRFNGIDSRIIIADNGALSTPSFSICYYFNTEVTQEQVCVGKIEYTTGYGATYNSAIYHQPNSTPFFSAIDPASPCDQQVPGTYIYASISPNTTELNQWYCVVNTFENGIQKLYVDGVLVAQQNLPFLNAKLCLNTNFLIGSWWLGDLKSFQGKLDDVRFYDRAINQQEINALCSQKIATDSLIINTYTPVIALNPCDNKITVEDATTFNIGDTVLMIQMKGAVIDSSNTAAFGNITDYKNAGNYEFNYVKSKAGNIIELKNVLLRQYDIPDGKVQLIRVPYFKSITVNNTLTCLPWDGRKGGVLVVNVKDTLILNAAVDVSGRGFHGGKATNSQNVLWASSCGTSSYYSASTIAAKQKKGEGITTLSSDKSSGRGPMANGGGGGNLINSGGGGGSNNNAGGKGGDQFEQCTVTPNDNGGLPGKSLLYSSAINKIFMGGGGGAGDANDLNGATSFNPDGGNGGGIVIMQVDYLNAKNFSIISNGDSGKYCITNCNEGAGGGGAGGTVLLQVNNLISTVNSVVCKGGSGSDNTPLSSIFSHGPGGGGSGGVLFINNTSLPSSIIPDLAGALNGVSKTLPTLAWGALTGSIGQVIFKLVLPFDTKPFKKNIDSVKITSTPVGCNTFDFKGKAFINGNAIQNWQWSFEDGTTADIQNTSHLFSKAGTFEVKLMVTDINGCADSTTTTVTSAGSTFDFSYKQNACNPLLVEFFNIGNTPINPFWLFGDGADNTGNETPSHLYATTGIYPVKYSVQNAGCTDTITKNILINIIKEDIILTKDTTICFGTSKQLLTTPSLGFCWSPITYLDDPLSANPVTNTPVPITYFFTAEIPGNNIITNGDFSSGNTDFTSQYNFASINTTEGQYFIGTNPPNWNPDLSTCADHTTGGGNMLLVNGAPVADVNVWRQTVTVTPNTNYAFATWIQALFPANPAQLGFSINGGDVGFLITAALPTCTWSRFYTTWNSGDNTTASIAIVNKNTFVQGNDFALDDISFSPVLIKRDSVIISIDKPVVKTNNDSLVCAGDKIQLLASGAASYNWLPSAGLSNAAISNPIATADATTQYIVIGTSAKGCNASDTVNIFTKALPVITKTADTSMCKNIPLQLFATGGVAYKWLPIIGLDNPSIANPKTSTISNIIYSVVVTGANSCIATDSIKITVRPDPVFTISPADTTCTNTHVQLNASGGDVYAWSPATMVSNPNIANPNTNNNNNIKYTVFIKENTCSNTATLSTTVTVLPIPIIKASKLNDINCSIASAALSVSGATQYVWTPSGSLNNNNLANPLASPSSTTLYSVAGTDIITNCIATDTVTVFVTKTGASIFFIPSAFTPNGDGVNDCFKVRHFNYLKFVDISIYNRYGSLVFHTTSDNDCWDGTYKGNAADHGNYVYYIKAADNCEVFYKKGNLILIR